MEGTKVSLDGSLVLGCPLLHKRPGGLLMVEGPFLSIIEIY